jgi:deoxycytidine triphosphate deaminase
MAKTKLQLSPDPTITAFKLANRHGSVLSDQDINAEINARRLIYTEDDVSCWHNKGVKWACYDFRIGHVVGKERGVTSGKQSVLLRPGELVTLLSKEWVTLPNNITGLIIPRNKAARKGLLILNAGHVDPGWNGQIMAQVINLSDQERSLELESFEDSVFAIVFNYLFNPAEECPRDSQPSEEERVREIHAAALQQAETLVLAESEMRDKFVARDAFSRILWVNAAGFLVLVGLVATISAPFVEINDLGTIGLSRKSLLMFGLLAVAVSMGVSLAQAVIVPLFSDWLSTKKRWQRLFRR